MFRSFSDKKSPRKSFRLKPPFTRHAISILICAACMLCATLASFLYQHIVPDNHANVALFYILALVIIARWTVGYGYGIVCTLFSVIAINYLFTYPYYKLNFTLTGYPITFLLMSGITLILCTMTSHMTIQSEMIAEREKRLAEAEMEKMRANLLRAISHDLRTPLTGIIGNSSLFLESQNDLSSTEQRTIMTNIYEDSNWLLNMVENLLSVTRIQGDSLSINTTEEPVEEVVGEALEHTGTITMGSGLVISYVPQDASHLQGTLSDFAKKNQIEEALFKAILRKLDFERIQFEKEIQDFSGGQKKKVLIAKSLCEQAHLYVWDEPLNFVDLYSRMQIEQLIREFSPTMLLVEHDQAFREAVATKTVQIEGAENEKRN